MYSAIRSFVILICFFLGFHQSSLAQPSDSSHKLVWYASYGSNLNFDRFKVYIDPYAPLPPGLSVKDHGCRDATLPTRNEAHTFEDFELYFADEKRTLDGWDGAAAFIRRRDGSHVLGRMYLITFEQFNDVMLQENGVAEARTLVGLRLPPLESIVKKRGFSLKELNDQKLRNALYDQVLYVGDKDGYPIFSFTTSDSKLRNGAPSGPYLQRILLGLHETYPAKPDAEIYHYLAVAPGINGPVDSEKLRRLSKQSKPPASEAH
jgi:hypothetical protein